MYYSPWPIVKFCYSTPKTLDFCPKTCHTTYMKNNQTTFRIIGFGTNEHGFFNQFHFRSDYMAAMNEYQNLVADYEIDGAVLLEVDHESWRVIEEFGTDGYCVVYGPVGNYKVEKAPQIVCVG